MSKVNFIEDNVAAVIKVELPSDNAQVVKDAFNNQQGLLVQISDTDPHRHEQETVFQLRLDANDRAGIVNEITQFLDGQNIRILDMDCHRVFLAGGAVSALAIYRQHGIEDPTCDANRRRGE